MKKSALIFGFLGLLPLGACGGESNGDIVSYSTGGEPATSNSQDMNPTDTSTDAAMTPGTSGTMVDSNQTDTDSGMTTDPPVSDCEDDLSTRGNDCNGVVTCGVGNDALTDPVHCPLSTHSCCVTGPSDDPTCVSGSECAADLGTRTLCDGPEECGGRSCCLTIMGTNAVMTCEDDCEAAGAQFQLCHEDDHCPVGSSCGSGGTPAVFPFWNTCM